ncbi:helix-turn-helix domain-containing protein [Gordonia sp. DT101]|uniref:helix-turn-helix domain-containing protein n=1 Tax=Gordonia sp. DT101 TaxID=3416545 RepID=UPI003CEC7948
MTTDQLAARWQVSTRTVREMAMAGEIPAIKLGAKLWRFPVERITKFERAAAMSR